MVRRIVYAVALLAPKLSLGLVSGSSGYIFIRNLDFSSISDGFWEPFLGYFNDFSILSWFFSAPVPPMSADVLLSIVLLQVAGVLGVRRCRSASTMDFQMIVS